MHAGMSNDAEARATVLSRTHLTAEHRSDLGTNLPGQPTAGVERTSVKRHHTATAGRIVQVRDSLFASLLEHKQEEKICVPNIPEGGVQEWSYTSGGKPLWCPADHQPRSVLDQLRVVRSKYTCPGVGRRETRLQRDRNGAVQGDGEQLCKRTAGQRTGEHQSCQES